MVASSRTTLDHASTRGATDLDNRYIYRHLMNT